MKIEWSDTIVQRMYAIMEYLTEVGETAAADKFYTKIWDMVYRIEAYPEIGKTSRIANIRYRRIGRYRRLYYWYDFEQDRIVLLDIFDARQDPSKNPY